MPIADVLEQMRKVMDANIKMREPIIAEAERLKKGREADQEKEARAAAYKQRERRS